MRVVFFGMEPTPPTEEVGCSQNARYIETVRIRPLLAASTVVIWLSQ